MLKQLSPILLCVLMANACVVVDDDQDDDQRSDTTVTQPPPANDPPANDPPANDKPDPPADSAFTITNRSDFSFVEINMSPSASSSWGDDMLDDMILYPNETVTIEMQCGVYDIRIIDEDADECVIEGIDTCANKLRWTLDNDVLLGCQANYP